MISDSNKQKKKISAIIHHQLINTMGVKYEAEYWCVWIMDELVQGFGAGS
jgi:hypothetical protein